MFILNLSKKIWNAFIESGEAADFEKEKKVEIFRIKRIGYKKFIKAMGWESVDDISRWRTNVIDVVPCVHCNKDFGTLDDHVGLCDTCFKKFDFRGYYELMANTCGNDPAKIGKMIYLFMVDKDFRKRFIK